MGGTGILFQQCSNVLRTCSKHVLHRNTEGTITLVANYLTAQNNRKLGYLSSANKTCSGTVIFFVF